MAGVALLRRRAQRDIILPARLTLSIDFVLSVVTKDLTIESIKRIVHHE